MFEGGNAEARAPAAGLRPLQTGKAVQDRFSRKRTGRIVDGQLGAAGNGGHRNEQISFFGGCCWRTSTCSL